MSTFASPPTRSVVAALRRIDLPALGEVKMSFAVCTSSLPPPTRGGRRSFRASAAKASRVGGDTSAPCAALPPLASEPLVPYQVIAFARADEIPFRGEGDGLRREQLSCRRGHNHLKTKKETK